MTSAAPVARRAVLVATLAASLTACGGIDERSVADDLQEAIEGVPEYAGGDIRFVDNATYGTEVEGILRVTGDDRAAVTAGFEAILEAVARAYPTGLGVNAADVTVTGTPIGDDPEYAVAAVDVLTARHRGKVTTDDLREHFGL